MFKKFALAFAGALALGAAAMPQEAAAGWRHGGWGPGMGHHHGHGWHGGWGRGAYWGGPRHWGPRRVFVQPYPVYRPYRPVVFARPVYRPYPVAYRPVGYGFGPRCTVIRKVGFTPYGSQKFVTVKKCIAP